LACEASSTRFNDRQSRIGHYSSQTDLDTGDLVSSGEEAGVLGRPLGRGTHTVLVVLTNKDTREVPELGLIAKNKKRQGAVDEHEDSISRQARP